MIFSQILMMLLVPPSIAALPIFEGGQPGCLAKVGSKSISDPQAQKILSRQCQAFRKNYLEAIRQINQKPKNFHQNLTFSLRHGMKKTFPRPSYDAILFSVLIQDRSQLPVLTEYADLEKKKNVRFRYATAAVEKLKNGKCKLMEGFPYDEICEGVDPALQKMIALSEVKRK